MGILAHLRQPDRLCIARWPLHLRYAILQSTPTVRGLWLLAALVLLLAILNLAAWYAQSQLQQVLSSLNTGGQALAVAQTSPSHVSTSTSTQAADAASAAVRQWPLDAEAEHISAEILALADAMGMIFERAEFQVMPGQGTTLQELRIKLPLKGDYVQIRQFLAQVLHRYPSLALSQCKLQRSDVMQAEIDAQIEFSLYTRKGGL